MIVKAIDATAKIVKVDPLDEVEQEEGKVAFSALFYQYGAKLSAELLLLSWVIAVIVPRVLTYIKRLEEERKAKQLGEGAPPAPPKLPEPAKVAQ